jgi:hypothetical protein
VVPMPRGSPVVGPGLTTRGEMPFYPFQKASIRAGTMKKG